MSYRTHMSTTPTTEPAEAPGTKTVRIPADLHTRLKATAALAGRTIESYAEELLRGALVSEDAA